MWRGDVGGGEIEGTRGGLGDGAGDFGKEVGQGMRGV